MWEVTELNEHIDTIGSIEVRFDPKDKEELQIAMLDRTFCPTPEQLGELIRFLSKVKRRLPK